MMSVADETREQVNRIIEELVGAGLADHQNYATSREIANETVLIDFSGSNNTAASLKNLPYIDIYSELFRRKQYNVLLLDGALLQLQYTFKNDIVIKHRLAFFPSPDLEEYQNHPELYEEELLFVDIVKRNIVATPVRIDFDSTVVFDDEDERFHHAESHMSIGQYKNCRIPTYSAISPSRFFEFILCSFYNSAFRKIHAKLPAHSVIHPKVILQEHEQSIHFGLETQQCE